MIIGYVKCRYWITCSSAIVRIGSQASSSLSDWSALLKLLVGKEVESVYFEVGCWLLLVDVELLTVAVTVFKLTAFMRRKLFGFLLLFEVCCGCWRRLSSPLALVSIRLLLLAMFMHSVADACETLNGLMLWKFRAICFSSDCGRSCELSRFNAHTWIIILKTTIKTWI